MVERLWIHNVGYTKKIPVSIIYSFLIDTFGEVKETTTGELRINSPFAQDSKFHMYINPSKGVVHDFKTDYGKDFISFAAEFLELGKRETIRYLIRNYSTREILENFNEDDIIIENIEELEIPNVTYFVNSNKGIIRSQAYNYLKNRKIPEQNIDKLGYIFDSESRYNKTIFIPFYENGKLVYFITRDFTGNSYLRYINPSGVDSSKFIYNIDEIEDTVFIFEGVLDALMLENQIGTATLNANLSKAQTVKILDRAPSTIVFVPDNDDTGKRNLDKNIETLLRYKPPSLKLDVLVYTIEEGKDLGETGKNSIDVLECKKWNRKDFSKLANGFFKSI